MPIYRLMKRFIKKIENFTCSHCGFFVKGTGYTNHCSKCLYSKHVDVNPGDRKALCQGLMKPIGIKQRHGEFFIIQKCTKCKFARKNKVARNDHQEAILNLS